MRFATFMAGDTGRAIRIVFGLVLVIAATTTLEGVVAAIAGVLGLTLFTAGVFNVCLIAPFIGAPFSGRDILARS